MSDPVERKLFDATWKGLASEVSSLWSDHPEINVNRTDEIQWTPLHTASLNGQAEVVKLLLAHPNIRVNVRDSYGQTPLVLGCQYGDVSVVEVLLKDPRVDVTLDDNNGCTPLWCASRYGHHGVIEWFIASGRDLGDIKNKKGNWDGKDCTALEIAREDNKTEAVSLLERFMPTQFRPGMRFV